MEMVTSAKLDVKKFQACYDRKEPLPQIKADKAEADSLGVNSIPQFFINGRPLYGAQPFTVFQKIIEAELKKTQH